MTFRAVFVTGAGVIANPDVLLDLQAAIGTFRGQHIDLTVEAHRDRRSERANNYLWAIYREIAAYTGHRVDDIHDAMVERFLPSERKRIEFFNRLSGEVLEIDTNRRRTSKLSGTAFFDFVEHVRLFASEFLGVETEDPDPEYWRARIAPRGASELRLHAGDSGE